MEKSSSAFRTISEVAAELDVPKHVLRFWEGKFPQLRPMKRGGGRRYYRPEDIELLRGIRWLLYSESYTIKGVQRILRDNGVKFVKHCWRDEPSFEIPNLAAEAASAARRPMRAAQTRLSRPEEPAAPRAMPQLTLATEHQVLLKTLLGDLEECRSLLQASVEAQEAAKPKSKSRAKRPPAEG